MQPRSVIPIRRQQIFSYLALAGFCATLTASCSDNSDISSVPEVPPNDAIADQPVEAIFYENVSQCQQQLTKQQQAVNQGKSTVTPSAPIITPEDCEAQLALALREHESNAPVYDTLEQCQTEGLTCSPATENGGQPRTGYYPSFGGTFIYPNTYDFVYFYHGGIQHRLYRPTTVYQGNAGNLVTPYGRSLPRYSPGTKILVPQHTRFTAPARPSGTIGSGVIRGRSSTGFGSTYKATGRGGIGK
jgi:uncharacterized protein YgiB involved in biofilm formation